jgi:hypothetical protein
MKLLLPLSLTAALFAGPVMAACAIPPNTVSVPNGSKASKDEMIAAQKAVKAYDADVKLYIECLNKDQDAEIAAGGEKMTDEQKAKVAGRYADKTNTEVDKLQKIADKFNAELKAYKAKNPA